VQSSKVFVPTAEAIAAARAFVAEALRTWGAMPPLIDDAMLMTSEMATNALVHAHSPFRISVARTGGVISFAVQDATSRTPQKRKVDAHSAMGRGMGIVDALSSRWGCDVLPTGKVVWAELLSPA
jgi:anti-sigma regulatory factor (Ser/Thr protein kinase)